MVENANNKQQIKMFNGTFELFCHVRKLYKVWTAILKKWLCTKSLYPTDVSMSTVFPYFQTVLLVSNPEQSHTPIVHRTSFKLLIKNNIEEKMKVFVL